MTGGREAAGFTAPPAAIPAPVPGAMLAVESGRGLKNGVGNGSMS
jgi:hypothetical protein